MLAQFPSTTSESELDSHHQKLNVQEAPQVASLQPAAQKPNFESCARKLRKSVVKLSKETPILLNFLNWCMIVVLILCNF